MKQYWAYDSAVEDEQARQLFKDKFGYVPKVIRTGGAVLCQLREQKANKEGKDAPKELQGLQHKLSFKA